MSTALDEWFISHVLPLEGLIHAFLRRHGHEDSEIPDLRQDAYARIYEAARRGLPAQTKPFVMTTVRNLLIDRIRRSRIVSIEAMAIHPHQSHGALYTKRVGFCVRSGVPEL